MEQKAVSKNKISLQSVSSIYIHTGNVLADIMKKTNKTNTQELVDSLVSSLQNWSISPGKDAPEAPESNTLVVNCPTDKMENNEKREDLKITVKVLMNTFQPSALKEALDKTLDFLNLRVIETVIVAFPHTDKKLTLDQMKPLWEGLEHFKEEKKVLALGASDLDVDQLTQLFNWAKVKPCINQVNLSTCCVIPEEMTVFAKENDIQLLTHGDPKEPLPEEQLHEALNRVTVSPDPKWRAKWIVRYSALVKGRGVIRTKGYIACLHIARPGSSCVPTATKSEPQSSSGISSDNITLIGIPDGPTQPGPGIRGYLNEYQEYHGV